MNQPLYDNYPNFDFEVTPPQEVFELRGVGALIIDEKGRILTFYHNRLGKRSIPVETVEEGESEVVALIRGMKEELGVVVLPQDCEFIGACQFPSSYKIEGNMPYKFNDAILFKVRVDPKAVVNNEPSKHSDMKFMYPRKIIAKGNLTRTMKVLLHYLGYLAD